MPVNTKYPNLPPEFPQLVRQARIEQGISLRLLSEKTGLPNVAINQIELGKRSCTYDRAIRLRDALGIDIQLPKPDLSLRDPITRDRRKTELSRESFLIEMDGRVIRVLVSRDLGPVTRVSRVEEK